MRTKGSDRHRITKRVRQELARRFPDCFLPPGQGPKRPLKLGIHQDLRKRLPRVPVEHLMWALRDYISGSSYLRECVQGVARVDLDGLPAGIVQAEHAAHAKAALQAVDAARQAKRKATRKSPRSPPGRPRAPQPREAVHGPR